MIIIAWPLGKNSAIPIHLVILSVAKDLLDGQDL